MDKAIEKNKWPPQRIAIYGGAAVGVLALGAWAIVNSSKTRLDVSSERITVSEVKRGEFQEYVPINGAVQASTTVYLDLEEGGIVEKILIEGGNPVKKGALILTFSNTAAQKQNIEAETRLLDNLNQLRNSKISLTTSNLILKDQLLDLDYKINELEKTFARHQQLIKAGNTAISREQFENTRDQLVYLKNKRDLLQERIRRESDLQEQQSQQVDSSIKRVNRNMDILARIVDSLEVRAPIDGQLSTLNAEVGQSFQRGQRIGQIDRLDNFKVRADIDQYYISKVAVGQHGTFEFNGRTHSVEVSKIFPEVTKDVFQADLAFIDGAPDGVKRGQTLQIDLSLSAANTTNLVNKGSFYRHTNGRWVYRVADDGMSAQRVKVVLGRQNPQAVEVIDGLQTGDFIITSDYEPFNDVDELSFSKSIKR